MLVLFCFEFVLPFVGFGYGFDFGFDVDVHGDSYFCFDVDLLQYF